MSAKFPCPQCQKLYLWKPEMVGIIATCKKCGIPFVVPGRLAPPPSSLANPASTDSPPQRLWAPGDPTVASNPGRLKIQWWKYFACHPKEPLLILTLVAVGFSIPTYFYAQRQPLWLTVIIGVGFFGWVAKWMISRVKEHFLTGCVCPAVVISTDPYLLAVSTDLTATGKPGYPAIKIIQEPLHKMTGGPPALGDRLATVALYSAVVGLPHWVDFDPRLVNCATTDEAAIARVFNSIPPDEWDELYRGLEQIPEQPKAGDLIMVK